MWNYSNHFAHPGVGIQPEDGCWLRKKVLAGTSLWGGEGQGGESAHCQARLKHGWHPGPDKNTPKFRIVQPQCWRKHGFIPMRSTAFPTKFCAKHSSQFCPPYLNWPQLYFSGRGSWLLKKKSWRAGPYPQGRTPTSPRNHLGWWRPPNLAVKKRLAKKNKLHNCIKKIPKSGNEKFDTMPLQKAKSRGVCFGRDWWQAWGGGERRA